MKLRELNEDQYRNEEILARAKNDFINKLVTNLGTVVDSTYAAQPVTTQPVTTQPTAPETPEQKRIRLQKLAQQRVSPMFKENRKFAKLNKIFESLLNVDEAIENPSESTSTLIISNFIKQMNAPHIFDINNPEIVNKLNQFATEIEQTYSQDKGRNAIKHLGEWAWDTMSEFKQRRKSTRLAPSTGNRPVQASTTSLPSINADGSITIAGAKGQESGKVLPGDPYYKQLAATINRQVIDK